MEYKFRKASIHCSACHKAFAEGEKFVSALSDTDALAPLDSPEKTPTAATADISDTADRGTAADTPALAPAETDAPPAVAPTVGAAADADDFLGFVRVDVCLECWPRMPTDRLFSWWRSERAVTIKKPPTKDPEFLWLLLTQTRRHAEPDASRADRDETAAGLAYIAALGLMRLKQVVLKRHFRHANETYLVFAQKDRKREFTVRDPDLSESAFEALEAQLAQVAETGEWTAPAPPAATPPLPALSEPTP